MRMRLLDLVDENDGQRTLARTLVELCKDPLLVAADEASRRAAKLVDVGRIGVVGPVDREERDLHAGCFAEEPHERLDQVVLPHAGRTHEEIGGRLGQAVGARRVERELVAQRLHRLRLVHHDLVQPAEQAPEVERGEQHDALVARDQILARKRQAVEVRRSRGCGLGRHP